ncbi:centrosomal protein of 70 kDa-like isoform X1 [Oncorhynchus keta]|uniref:centrosomal protein of 70 kDa-like isoform X1 n=1 Tax=Oncorhynchus keta TaxID=8018 RepID=UPI00227C5E9D|nr:centrosomal protein of 70 kDa-like isoform X1 [Oncorhynchus keta]
MFCIIFMTTPFLTVRLKKSRRMSLTNLYFFPQVPQSRFWGSQTSDQSQSTTGVSPNHKALLKSYQEQLMDTKAQREELRNEIQQLEQDLESRPTVKELKSYKEQLRCMDRLIQQSNMKSAQEFKEEGRAALSNQEVAKARALAARHEKVLRLSPLV